MKAICKADMIRRAALFFAAAVLMAGAAGAYPDQPDNATAHTYTAGAGGQWIRTQNAYLTGEVLFQGDPLNGAQDLFAHDGILYLADTERSRIIAFDRETGAARRIGEGVLKAPTGLFAAGELLYAADVQAQKVFVFDASTGALVRSYGRPREAAFGEDSPFKPRKVQAAASGILTIVSEGSYDGMIQLSAEGEFLGYFGHNAVPMTFSEILGSIFYTRAQKSQLFNKIPLSFYNAAQDSDGVVYTVTKSAGTAGSAVKKHNVSGTNILKSDMRDEADFEDVAIGPGGEIFAVTSKGLIFEYDNTGELLFSFGGPALRNERAGLFSKVSAIDADERCTLFVLDSERGLVHTFYPASLAEKLHGAIASYNAGDYQESIRALGGLQVLAGSTLIVPEYIARNYYQLGDFGRAAYYYRSAENRAGYSSAFWEIRGGVIGFALPVFFAGIVLLIAAAAVFRALRKRGARAAMTAPGGAGMRLLRDLRFGLQLMRHPFDGYDDIRHGRRGGLLSATVLYLAAFFAFALNLLGTGFAFSPRSLSNTPFIYVLVLFAPVPLFVLCSYFVSEIHHGIGTLRGVYTGMAYTLVPVVVFLPLRTLLSHILTAHEAFLLSVLACAACGWTAFLVVAAIRELHDYDYPQVFANILLALFMMIVLLFVASMVGMFWDRIADMASSIAREVLNRAYR